MNPIGVEFPGRFTPRAGRSGAWGVSSFLAAIMVRKLECVQVGWRWQAQDQNLNAAPY